MLNLYITLRVANGRLHPCGVDVQVEDALLTWVSEDGWRLLVFYRFWFWSLS